MPRCGVRASPAFFEGSAEVSRRRGVDANHKRIEGVRRSCHPWAIVALWQFTERVYWGEGRPIMTELTSALDCSSNKVTVRG